MYSPGPLPQIETSVTFCGMVGVRAKVLGRMGWTTSPHLRAGALSCPPLAIYGPGSYGVPASIMFLAALVPALGRLFGAAFALPNPIP
jgi:hypothetical protein